MDASSKPDASDEARIIVGLVEHMGDIVACEPVARYLKLNRPNSRLTWAVLPRYRELIDTNPYIDETLPVDCLTDWMKVCSHGQYDDVIDLHVNYRVCQCCRIPLTKRTGNPFVTAFNWFDHGSLLEAFSLGAGLPRLSGQPRLYLRREHVEAVDALDLPGDYCVIHRKSNEVEKDWTESGWCDLIAMIRSHIGLDVVEIGSGKVDDLPRPIRGVVSLVNRLPILQSAEVIRRARMFVGVDSGPAHFANALEVPGVVVLGQYSFFNKYCPFTGFYATSSPLVRLVRNSSGLTADIALDAVAEAVRYAAAATKETPQHRVAPESVPSTVRHWPPPREPGGELIAASGLFDVGYYAVHYPEVIGSSVNPIDHYLLEGAARGFIPGATFDSASYLESNPDIAASGINPLLHYIEDGWRKTWRIRPPDRGPHGDHRADANGRPSMNEGTLSQIMAQPREPLDALGMAPRDELPTVLAFYLPQFHPIPENDWAHGPGFTEWNNVIKAKPLFRGHYQPRRPGELGFYDLRSEEVLHEQIKLAQEHGISGFCFYYYFFAGRKLLFRPLENFVKSDIDAPFMCLWANENWTKRWDGGDREVIIAQHHSDTDDLLALRELVPLFADRRYVKVRGKPVLMIYKVDLFPDIRRTANIWREEIVRHGFPDLFLVMVDDWTPDPVNPREIGFDASYEIPSNIVPSGVIKEDMSDLDMSGDFTGRIIEYPKFAGYHMGRPFPTYKRFKTVMLPWDNTPRYGSRAMVYIDGQGEDYKLWLMQALLDTYREYERSERFVFIHSWNEWCEGTYLEPDGNLGRFYLEQTREAIEIVRQALLSVATRPPTEVIVELLKLQRAKDAGAFQVVASTRMQTHYAYQSMISERNEVAALRDEVHHLRRVIADQHAGQTYTRPPTDAAESERNPESTAPRPSKRFFRRVRGR